MKGRKIYRQQRISNCSRLRCQLYLRPSTPVILINIALSHAPVYPSPQEHSQALFGQLCAVSLGRLLNGRYSWTKSLFKAA